MNYFGRKVRNCLVQADDIEMTLLKLFIRQALIEGTSVSYGGRLFVTPSKNEFSILRREVPETAIEVPLNRASDATDRFIESFVFEADASLDLIVFHEANDITTNGCTWAFLKGHLQVLNVLLVGKEKLQNTLSSVVAE